MKRVITVILIFAALIAQGQIAKDFLQKGIEKHKSKDYKGAIKEYNKAIKLDNTLVDAYYNRGVCSLAIQDLESAKSDFDRTIELDSASVDAYYSRATVFATQEKYNETLSDLDKVIKLDRKFPKALILRGQIRAQTGDRDGACEDFREAKLIGDKQAKEYINQFCGNEQLAGESLMLDWPDSENWKIGSNQESNEMAVIELIHADEALDNWTEFGYMMSLKGVTGVPMDKAMNLMFDEAKKNSPKAKLTFIEKDEIAEYPWIIFTIESPYFKNDKNPESQLWFIIQGKSSLYTNFRAVKKETIPAETKEKWIEFFKTGKIVYK